MEVCKVKQYRAIFLSGAFSYQGLILQSYQNGTVIIFDGIEPWAIKPGISIKHYRAVIGDKVRRLVAIKRNFY